MNRRSVTAIGLLAAFLIQPAQPATDPSRCYSIRDADLRNACLAETRGEKGQCYAIKDHDQRQLCLARITGQKSTCYNIRDKDQRAACQAGMGGR